MTDLRAYQANDVSKLRAAFRNHRRVLYQLPTGGGKTVVYSWLAKQVASRGKRVTIVEHRRELVRQASAKLADAGVEHGIIDASTRQVTRHPVQVASVQTLVRRLDQYPAPDLLVIDEAHHSVAGTWDAVQKAYSSALTLGVTATPERLDGRGLGTHYEAMVIGPPMRELIWDGYLADYVAYRRPGGALDLTGVRTVAGDYDKAQLAQLMTTPGLVGDAVKHYQKHCDGRPAIAFCVTVAHAEAVANMFVEAGYRAYSVDGTMPDDVRDARICGLADGSTQILTSCQLVSEGLDIPGVVAAILLRPTKSLGMYLQQVGRALRPKPDGSHAIILDHAGNMDTHGAPCDPREWSLLGRKKKAKAKTDTLPVQTCFECYATVSSRLLSCPHCGAMLKEPEPLPEVIDADLEEFRPVWTDDRGFAVVNRGSDSIDSAVKQCTDFRDIKALGKALGYKPAWATRVAQGLKWEPILNKSGWPVHFIPRR